MLERDVEERGAGLGKHVRSVAERSIDMDAPAAAVADPGGDSELAVDENRAPVADEDPRRNCREAVPGSEKAARLVERCPDEPAVDDAGPCLMPLPERKRRLVALDPLLSRKGEMNPLWVVAAPPACGIVVWRDPLYRRPPRSKCAL